MTSAAPAARIDDYESERKQLAHEQKILNKLLSGMGGCALCGNSNPLVLEEHHIAGRKNSDTTVTVCANHHAVLSRTQASWPEEWRNGNLPSEKRVALILRGISDFLRVASDEMWVQTTDTPQESGAKCRK